MRILSFCLCALLLVSVAFAAESGVEAALQQKYADMQSLKASFTQRLTHKESGNVDERSGTLSFKKPLLLRWEILKPHKQTLIVSDKDVWEYVPDEQLAYRYSPSVVQDSGPMMDIITGQARLDKDFTVKAEGTEGGLRKLRLLPKEPTPQVVEAVLYVDDKNLIRRVYILDFYGNGNDVRFSAVTPDAKLPATTFAFTPPKGVEVEDHRGKPLDRELLK